jgi:hypothetical protein
MLALSAAADLHSSDSSPSFAEQQDSSNSSSGKCPFLAALPTPPPAQNAFWRRLQQLFSPAEYQQEALGPHSMVEAPMQVRWHVKSHTAVPACSLYLCCELNRWLGAVGFYARSPTTTAAALEMDL